MQCFCVRRGIGLGQPPARFGVLRWAFAFTAWASSAAASAGASRALDRLVARAGGRLSGSR